MRHLIIIIIAIIFSLSANYVMGQCEVTGSASSTSITCGDCIYLSAFGQGQGQTIFSEDFNTGTYGAGWSSSSQAMWNNPCSAGGVDGTTHIWMGNSSPVPRILATQAYDLSGAPAGASICFDMLLAEQGNAAPCEGPDEPQEGIYVQYSVDGGATWLNIHYFDPNGGYDPQFINWNNWCFNLPAGAMTSSTMFRWFQDNDSGADYDHWGIDNVNIYFNDPTYQIIWQHDGYNLGAVGGTDPTPVCPSSTTTYTVEMSNGTSTCTDNVTVNVSLPNIIVSASPDTSLCTGSCTDLQGVATVIVSPAKTPTYENNELSVVTSGNASVGINITDLNMTQILPGSITQVCINSFNFSGTQLCTSFGGCNCNGTPISFGDQCNLDISSFNVFLTSPTGCQITLVPQFEAAGTQYQNVCFIPSGGQNISDPSFPTSGNWNPSQPFDNLVGCDANGVWNLEFDAPGGLGFGVGSLTGWTISFDDPEISYTGNYSWSPTTDMTNSTSLTPNVCPSANTTYTLAVSDTAGCVTVTDAAVVTVNPCSLNLTFKSAIMCEGECTDIEVIAAGGTSPYTYTWNPPTLIGPGPHAVCPATTTTYSVTVTDATSSTAVGSGTVTVIPPPPVSAGNDVILCMGNSTTLTASGASTYDWDNSLGAGASHTVSPLASTTYSVTGTDSDGCTAIDQVDVTVVNGPTPTITGSLTFCSGNSTTLDAGAGYSSYLWTGGSTLQTLVVSSAGSYSVTVTDVNGCTGTTSVNVTQNASLNPTISGTLSICSGNSTTLDAGAGYNTYLWAPNGETSQTISTTTAGIYSVTVTDGGSCSGNASVTVNSYSNPTPTISGTLSICSGNSTTLDAGAYSSYNWSNSETTQTINVSTSGTFIVTVTDANGCSGTDQVTTTVNSSPTPTITGSLTFCSGFSTTLDAGTGYSSYLWTGGSTLQTLVVNSSGTYYVTVTDGNGCTGATSVDVTQSSTLSPSISGGLAICSGNATTLNAGSGYADYLWSPGGETTQTISASATGTYSVTVSDGGGCTGTASVNVNAYSNPTPSITGPNSFCFGDTITLDAGAGYSSYNWLPAAASQTYLVTAGGNYSVTVTDANGCSGTDAVAVTAYPGVTLSFGGGVTDFCSGDTVVVDAGSGFVSYDWSNGDNTQIVYLTTGGNYIVSVTDANGCGDTSAISLNEHISPVPDVTGNLSFCQGDSSLLDAGAGFNSYLWLTPNYETTQTIYALYTGVYYVVVDDAFGCYGIDSAEVTVNPNPMPAITGNLAFCTGSNTVLDAGSGYNSYSWSPGAEVSQSITVTTPGTYSVTVSDNIGCLGNDVVDVVEYAGIDLSFAGGPIDFCSGDTVVIDAGAGLVSYDWSNGDSTQVVYLTTGGFYIVTVTDVNGCSDTAGITLNEHISPVPDITGNLSFCQGDSSLLDAGSGFNSYLWFTPNYETTQTIYALYSGTYYVVVDDAFGCYGIDSVVVDVIANPIPILSIVNPPCFEDDATVSVSNISSLATYSWNFSGGVAVPGTGAGPHTISWGSAGNHTVSVTVTDNGCSGSASSDVNVPNQLVIDSNSKIDALCNGSNSGSINVIASGGTGQLLYSISGPTQTNGIFSNLAAGDYFVTVNDANACSVITNQITISQPTALSLSVNSGDSICAGTNYNIIANCIGGTSPYNYSWKDGSGNIIGGNNPSITVSPNNTSLYFVNVSDANNCNIGPVVSTLNVSPPISISYTTQNVSCKGKFDGKITFNVTGGIIPYTFTGSTWTTTSNIKDSLYAGTYPVNIKDSWGCPPKDTTFTITEPLALTFSTNSIDATCYGKPDGIIYINVTPGTGTAPYSYNWSNGISTSDSLVDGVGRYYVTVTDANNCQVIATDSIKQPTQVTLLTSTHSEKICKGQTTILDASAYGGTQPYTYSWIWVSPEDSTTHVGTGTNLSVTPNLTTSYTLSAKDFNGCISSLNATITVIVNKDITAEVFPNKQTICPGDSVLVNTQINGGNGGPYLCTLQDGTVVTENFYIYPEGQDTTIYYTFTAKDLCGSPQGTDNFTIKILALPPVSIFADTLFGCQPLKVSFMDSSKFIGQSYFWTFTNLDANVNSFSYSKYPTINFTEAGVYDVTIITTSIDGCQDSITKPEMITVYPNPISEFEVDPQVQSKINPIFYFQNLSSTTYLCEWNFGDDNFSNEINPVHTYLNIPGNYLVELTVETEKGCVNTSSTTVIVKDEYTFFTPTAFSPDNDGINDIFFISGSGIDPKFFHLIIYDRWGEIVYETKSYNPENPKQYGWDGSIKGIKKAEVGTYTWLCTYKNLNGEERQQAGPITIIR